MHDKKSHKKKTTKLKISRIQDFCEGVVTSTSLDWGLKMDSCVTVTAAMPLIMKMIMTR
jgi:hypothetical protein